MYSSYYVFASGKETSGAARRENVALSPTILYIQLNGSSQIVNDFHFENETKKRVKLWFLLNHDKCERIPIKVL